MRKAKPEKVNCPAHNVTWWKSRTRTTTFLLLHVPSHCPGAAHWRNPRPKPQKKDFKDAWVGPGKCNHASNSFARKNHACTRNEETLMGKITCRISLSPGPGSRHSSSKNWCYFFLTAACPQGTKGQLRVTTQRGITQPPPRLLLHFDLPLLCVNSYWMIEKYIF